MREVHARTVVVVNVESTENTEAFRVIQEVRTGWIVLGMMKEIGDLGEDRLTAPAEEWILIGQSIAVEAILRALEGKGANAIPFHTAALLEMEE